MSKRKNKLGYGKYTAIHCETRRESDYVLRLAKLKGYDKFSDMKDVWEFYQEYTCYVVETGHFFNYEDCIEMGFNVITAEDYV